MKTFTPEDRAKGAEARLRSIRDNPYRKDWLDANLWADLALARQIRLPQWNRAPTPRRLIQALGTLRPGEVFRDVYGCSPRQLIERNPTTPLRAFIGQMLESAR